MKTSRCALLVLLTILLAGMVPARALTLNQAEPWVDLSEMPPGAPGMPMAPMRFRTDVYPTAQATVTFSATLMPGNINVGGGTLIINGNTGMSPWAPVQVSYASLPPSGNAQIIVTTGTANGITVQPSYTYSVNTGSIVRALTVSGGSVVEGNTGTSALPFTITMNKVLSAPLTFTFTPSGGTAAAGDYVATPGTATIPAGQTSVTVQVSVNGDTLAEENETVGLTLSGFSQLAMAGTSTPGTILTDDFPPGPAPSATMVTELPSSSGVKAWFSVDLSAARTQALVCRVSTRNGTALAGSDYQPLAPVNITFAPGEVRKWVSITLLGSPAPETTEHFFLDAEALDSHEIKSAACTIEPLTAVFDRVAPDVYRVRFPGGTGQRYVVEESASLTAWAAGSGVFTGTGELISHVMLGDVARKFYRVTVLTPQPPGTAAASS